MSKRKRKPVRLSLPPASLFRLRLDDLWQDPALPGQTDQQIEAGLSAVARSFKPDLVAATVLAAFQAAPAPARERLAGLLPAWLAGAGAAGALEDALASARLFPDQEELAAGWLSALGREVSPPESTFHSARRVGNEWQVALNVLWYANRRKTRARGMEFLIDFNPPWDGAVKDIVLYPTVPPDELAERHRQVWERSGQPVTPLGPGEFKRELLTALNCNRASGIRLPRELVLLRAPFVEHILSLPDAPGAPPFTAQDFDELSRTGQSAEEIMHFEQTVARRARMADGKELYIDAAIVREGLLAFDDETL